MRKAALIALWVTWVIGLAGACARAPKHAGETSPPAALAQGNAAGEAGATPTPTGDAPGDHPTPGDGEAAALIEEEGHALPLAEAPIEEEGRLVPLDSTETTGEQAPEPITLDNGSGLEPLDAFRHDLPAPKATTPFSINFEEIDIREVIHQFTTEILGIDVIIGPGVQGTITVYSSEKIQPDKAWDVFLTLLAMNNLSIARSGSYYKILPTEKARTSGADIGVGAEVRQVPDQDALITQIIPLKYLSPQEANNLLQYFKSDDGVMVAHGSANILIVSDYKAHVRRMLQLLRVLDVDMVQRELQVLPIRYAKAEDVQKTLETILQAGAAAGETLLPRRIGDKVLLEDEEEPTFRAVGQGAPKPVIIADQRSNILIVFASRREIAFIKEIIRILDVDIYVSEQTYVYYVENAQATDVAEVLNQLYSDASEEDERRGGRTPAKETGGAQPRPAAEQAPASGAEARPFASGTVPGAVHGKVKIVADERTNALVIVTSPLNWPHVKRTIEQLDIMPTQVMVEVLIAEVSLDDDWSFGVAWQLKSVGNVTIDGERYDFDSDTRLNNDSIARQAPGFVYGIFETTRFTGLLNAFARDSRLNVLSRPHLMATNNKEAKIEIAQEVPVPTSIVGTAAGGGTPTTTPINTSINYRDTGIILTLTPRINTNRSVNMEVKQEVSEIQDQIVVAGTEAPLIRKRKVDTSVAVADDQSLVIGGLISQTESVTSGGLPWLHRIPFLGRLFGNKKRNNRRTELLIMITPHIVSSYTEGHEMVDDIRVRIPAVDKLIKNPRSPRWWRP